MNNVIKLVAIDAKTGLHLRDATETECAAFLAGNTGKHPSFYQTVRLSADISIKEDSGYGIWFGGAGF